MKKLLLLIVILVIITIISQKFGLLTNFPNDSKPTTEKQLINIPSVNISQTIIRPIIGIHYRMIDKLTADQNNLVEGAYITQIIKRSPAEKANLQEEDIIIEFDGIKISSTDKETLNKLMAGKKPGERIVLKIWRNKEIKTIFVTLETTQ
jgi:S1-C subfamily serine protease